MIKERNSSINNSSEDDLMIELANLKPFILSEDHYTLIEKNMLKVFKKQCQKNNQKHSSLLTYLLTIWEPSLIMIIFVFLGWDVFSIISYLLMN